MTSTDLSETENDPLDLSETEDRLDRDKYGEPLTDICEVELLKKNNDDKVITRQI